MTIEIFLATAVELYEIFLSGKLDKVVILDTTE